MSEKLEFSLEDLGRLAAAIDGLEAITEWVVSHAPNEKIAEDATAKVRAGYEECREVRQEPSAVLLSATTRYRERLSESRRGSLWAQVRADEIFERWTEDPTLKLKDLVSEALDAAEAYGRDRAVLFSAVCARPEAPTQAPEDPPN